MDVLVNRHTHTHPMFPETQSPDLVVELLVARVKGLQFFTNEFIQYAPVYQRLTQLPDLRPVVPGMTKRALERLQVEEKCRNGVNVLAKFI